MNSQVRLLCLESCHCLSETEATVAARFAAQGRDYFRPLRFDCAPNEVLADFALLGPETERPLPVFVMASSGCRTLDAAKRATAHLLLRRPARATVLEADGWATPSPPLPTQSPTQS